MLFVLKIAVASLRIHRLRTILAIVGVLLGALCLTAVQHIGQAMYGKAEAETAKLGTNLFMARSGQLRFSPLPGTSRARREATTFTIADAEALIQQLPMAKQGSPFATRSMPVRSGSTKVQSSIFGVWPAYLQVRDLDLAVGRFFTADEERESAKVCVLGSKVAERLFGSSAAALGEQVFFFRANARVIGVLAPKGTDIVGSDQDDQVLVPLSTYLRRFANQDWISGVYITLAHPEDETMAKATTEAILRQRHHLGAGKKDDFFLMTARDTMKVQQQALDLVRTLGWISSGVSFAVGGLGILSIMVLLARTRRLEIGVRRAVGARRRDIIRQFIFESGLMAATGGLLGVLGGLGLAALASFFGEMPFHLDLFLVTSVLGGSLGLGLLAGAYPAWEAAQVEVLEVLRGE
uniref:ABC transporter permease n=1 Tax=uncultured bacterium pAY4-1 TaxID=1781157 RepID=A0A1C9U4T5_9BACT|nr:ABC transporter permease [uncultured bacterium pAY4-1]